MSIHAAVSRLLVATLLLAEGCAFAVTPVSPRLTPEARASVERQLEDAGVPEVGWNSVAIAVLSALSSNPAGSSSEYDEPYRQLPKVSVATEPSGPECLRVSARIRGEADAGYGRVLLTGTFCRVGTALWAASGVRARPEGTP